MIWKKTRRTKATAKWLEETDPIKLMTYYILYNVKYLVMALVIYIFILTVSEGVFMLQNVGDHTVVGFVKQERRTLWVFQKKGTNSVGVGVKNFGFKKQTSIMKSSVLGANVTEELLPLEYR
jgi:hypothetical protein